jgi:hypothetical protein
MAHPECFARPLLHASQAFFSNLLEGLTPEGRAIVRLLDFNTEEHMQLRRLLMWQDWRP